jgi:hypothetical protein
VEEYKKNPNSGDENAEQNSMQIKIRKNKKTNPMVYK